MTYCLNRHNPPGTDPTSWARPHICREPTGHPGPHQCTCHHQWEPATTATKGTP